MPMVLWIGLNKGRFSRKSAKVGRCFMHGIFSVESILAESRAKKLKKDEQDKSVHNTQM